MMNIIDPAIKCLKSRKQSEFIDHEKLVMLTFTTILPKESKALNTNLVKKIFSIEEDLSLVLIGHLYLEKLVNGILSENLENFETLEKKGILNSFYKKVIYLKSERITPDQILDDFLIINQLRNKYAHELNYDLSEFKIFELSFLKKHKGEFQIKRKKSLRILNRILIRHSIFHLLRQLTDNHRCLYLINEK